MNETYVAVLFGRILNHSKFHVFAPYSCSEVIKGESSLFVMYNGEKIYNIEKAHIIFDESLGLYYGYLTSIEDLKKKYGEKNLKELMTLYLKEYKDNLYIGLDIENGNLKLRSLSLEPIISISDNSDEIGKVKEFKIVPIKEEEE